MCTQAIINRLKPKFHSKFGSLKLSGSVLPYFDVEVDPKSSKVSTTTGTWGMPVSFVWTQTGLHLSCSAVGWWMASSLQVKPRSFTIPLYRSCLTRWGSASWMPLTRASGIRPGQ